MEPLWGRAGATGGNWWQMQEARNPCSQAETVAVGCDRLPREPHGPCLGVKHGPREIEVHLLNSVSERHDRAALAGYIESWKADHIHASVEIVSG